MSTDSNKRSQLMTLTIEQEKALPLLMTGLSDREVAEQVGVRRETVTKWRNHHPAFRAELNRLRGELHDQTLNGLRNLIPQAIAALADVLADRDHGDRVRVALEMLKMVRLPDDFPSYHGPETAEDVLEGEAWRKKNGRISFGEEPTASDLIQAAKELEKKLS